MSIIKIFFVPLLNIAGIDQAESGVEDQKVKRLNLSSMYHIDAAVE